MWIGILSDTHGRLDRTEQAVECFQSLQVELLIHCGDVGTPAVLDLLAAWPVHFVLGNTDSPWSFRDGVRPDNALCYDRFGQLELEGRQIAFLHGDDARRFRETVRSGQWDLVCYGHSHLAEITTEGTTLLLNPGALHRASHPSIALVELPSLRAELVML